MEIQEHPWTPRTVDISRPRIQGIQKIEWENGEITMEPIGIIKEDDPVTLAAYTKEHNLLDTDGWKSLKQFVRREKRLKRLIRQAKLQSF